MTSGDLTGDRRTQQSWGRIHESILRSKSLLRYNFGNQVYSRTPPILREVLIFLLYLGGQMRVKRENIELTERIAASGDEND